MRKLFTLLLILCMFQGIAQEQHKKSLRAYLSYAMFYVPGAEPYIETYLAVDGNSVYFKETEPGNFKASIEIIMLFKQHDSIVDYAKYALNSPSITDTSAIDFGFIDQQRFSLPTGEYQFELIISDINNELDPPFQTLENIQLEFSDNEVGVSGIQLIESYEKTDTEGVLTKNGYNLIPLVYAFYPESMKSMSFYAEVYHTDKVFGKDSGFLLNYYIESFESGKIIDGFQFRKRTDSKPVNIVFNTIDISDLPSGNYKLVLEVRDRDNKQITQNSLFFRRSNPGMGYQINDLATVNISNTFVNRITAPDSLREYLLCLEPISSEVERDYVYNLIAKNETDLMKKYLYNFWVSRNYSSPEEAWQQYYYEVQKVNLAYKTPTKKGYATDRGRVYLKYGPPNQIMESYNEPGAYPYEIWQYYTLGNQRNKRFVFYTRDMATNDFVLIHSDAFGELANYRWQLDIYRRTWDPNSIDETAPEDTWGNRATQIIKDLK
ncbi:MAG: GWxTD domain-containing protein [Bacteroidales bacterium]|nr:GWxTD domain-containing protein [Bacteroidales bacterium]HOI32473.1 GWxTD domain-containing protein [Bacteroidales bacterium]